MKYIMPGSLTWWGGLSSIIFGVGECVVERGFSVSGFEKICMGLTAIGLRKKLQG